MGNKKMINSRRSIIVIWIALLCSLLCSCTTSLDSHPDFGLQGPSDGYNSAPPCMHYEGETYNLVHVYSCEVDIEGRKLELLGTAYYAGDSPSTFTKNFQTNDLDLDGAEVYRQTNAQTTGLLIVKIGEKYYEIGSGW